MIARPQSFPLTVRCTCQARGDRASRSVWCSHGWLAPAHGNHVSTRCRRLTALGPGKRKKGKTPLRGGVCLLTRGVLIRVRCGVPRHWECLCPCRAHMGWQAARDTGLDEHHW
jgi:hypothetical protein